MAGLNQVTRLFYVAKNHTTGLVDVEVNIVKPDLTVDGPFVMTEIPEAEVQGTYYYDWTPAAVGDYLVACDCVSLPKRAEQKVSVNQNLPFMLY